MGGQRNGMFHSTFASPRLPRTCPADCLAAPPPLSHLSSRLGPVPSKHHRRSQTDPGTPLVGTHQRRTQCRTLGFATPLVGFRFMPTQANPPPPAGPHCRCLVPAYSPANPSPLLPSPLLGSYQGLSSTGGVPAPLVGLIPLRK